MFFLWFESVQLWSAQFVLNDVCSEAGRWSGKLHGSYGLFASESYFSTSSYE